MFRLVVLGRMRMSVGLGVVLVVVDLAAFLILLVLDLAMLLRRQTTAIRRAIVVNFVVDSGFVVFDVRSFTRG